MFQSIEVDRYSVNLSARARHYTMEPDWIIRGDLDEIVDDVGHFQVVASVPQRSYPDRKLVALELYRLNPFSKDDGFVQVKLKKDRMYYLIAKSYVRLLMEWISNDGSVTPDLTVDNMDLMVQGTRSKLWKHSLPQNAQVVPKDVWDQLMNWFGGGPEASIRAKIYEEKISLYGGGKILRVVCQNDVGKFRRFLFNFHENLNDVKDEICEVFNVKPRLSRLHDYFKNKPFTELGEAHLHRSLESCHIMHDNLLFLELPDEKGKYKITYRHHSVNRV